MSGVDVRVQQWLQKCGVSRRVLSRCAPETRIYHDLGAYGEVAEAWLELLQSDYGVELQDFDFQSHFPPEFEGQNALARTLFWLVPFAGAVARSRKGYSPVTLRKIDEAFRCGRLVMP
jgi:hypothetical protein